METILNELAGLARTRVEREKANVPLEVVRREAEEMSKGSFEFEKALKTDGLSFICECKKASPSKGIIAEDFPYLEIAKSYEEIGADCISVLTEPYKFLGRDEYLEEICREVKIPVLRKDFTVDEYMIYRAKVLGADAVLLICSILDTEEIKYYIDICDSLGVSALVETHDEREIDSALTAGARIIGVNNRNLKDFTVDMSNSCTLRRCVPESCLYVSESGVKCREDVKHLEEQHVDACLIGEAIMRSKDKRKFLDGLRYEN